MNGINFRRRMLMGAAHYNASFGLNNYLTIEALEDNLTVTFTNTIEYTIDGREWIRLKAKNETQPINIGQTLRFRGELSPNSSDGIGTFTINKKCNLKGNCMSMLFGDNAADNYSLSGKDYAFYSLFQGCSNIVNVDSNFLPATTLATRCYSHMFQGCSNLTSSPELPATTLATSCYSYMFQGCSNLTSSPELPATTLATSCYSYMFHNCSHLTASPELPATTLVSDCYSYMFYGCTRIATIRCRARRKSGDILFLPPTYYWLNRIGTKIGTFYGYSTYGWDRGASGIPRDWNFVNLTD